MLTGFLRLLGINWSMQNKHMILKFSQSCRTSFWQNSERQESRWSVIHTSAACAKFFHNRRRMRVMHVSTSTIQRERCNNKFIFRQPRSHRYRIIGKGALKKDKVKERTRPFPSLVGSRTTCTSLWSSIISKSTFASRTEPAPDITRSQSMPWKVKIANY